MQNEWRTVVYSPYLALQNQKLKGKEEKKMLKYFSAQVDCFLHKYTRERKPTIERNNNNNNN